MKTVLVVDEDNPEIAELIKESLRGECAGTVCKDFKMAWETLSKEVIYDVVVAGGRKGADLLARIFVNRKLSGVRRVLMSGDPELAVQADKLEARFLPRPFEREWLLEALR